MRLVPFGVMAFGCVVIAGVPAAAQTRSSLLNSAPLFRFDVPARLTEPRPVSRSDATPTLMRQGTAQPFGIVVHGGLSTLGSGGAIDELCDSADDFLVDVGFDDYGCESAGKGTAVMFGGYLSYSLAFTDRVNWQFQGGAEFTTQHSTAVDLFGIAEFSQNNTVEFNLTGGYRFNSQTFYGGAGFEFANLYVGARVGIVRHSGEEFLVDAIRQNGQVLEEHDETRDRSGTSPFLGLRASYQFRPGLFAYADVDCWKPGNLYEMFGQDDFPYPTDVEVKHRRVAIGVAIDITHYLR